MNNQLDTIPHHILSDIEGLKRGHRPGPRPSIRISAPDPREKIGQPHIARWGILGVAMETNANSDLSTPTDQLTPIPCYELLPELAPARLSELRETWAAKRPDWGVRGIESPLMSPPAMTPADHLQTSTTRKNTMQNQIIQHTCECTIPRYDGLFSIVTKVITCDHELTIADCERTLSHSSPGLIVHRVRVEIRSEVDNIPHNVLESWRGLVTPPPNPREANLLEPAAFVACARALDFRVDAATATAWLDAQCGDDSGVRKLADGLYEVSDPDPNDDAENWALQTGKARLVPYYGEF